MPFGSLFGYHYGGPRLAAVSHGCSSLSLYRGWATCAAEHRTSFYLSMGQPSLPPRRGKPTQG